MMFCTGGKQNLPKFAYNIMFTKYWFTPKGIKRSAKQAWPEMVRDASLPVWFSAVTPLQDINQVIHPSGH